MPSPLVEHIRQFVNARNSANDKVPTIMETLREQTPFSQENKERSDLGGKLSRIFDKAPESINAIFKQVAESLEKRLALFEPAINNDTVAETNKIIDDAFALLAQDPEWKKLLSEINNEERREAFKKDLRIAFMFKSLSNSYGVNKKISADQVNYFKIIYNNENPKKALQKLNEQFKPPVKPTVFYYHGKNTISYSNGKIVTTAFGHTAVGLIREHDLILSATPPPTKNISEDKNSQKIEDYIAQLPLDADHNGIIIYQDAFYYLNRNAKTPSIHRILDFAQGLPQLKTDYPALREKAVHHQVIAKSLPVSEVLRIGSLIKQTFQVIQNESYLSYGAGAGAAGKGDYSTFGRETESYGKYTLITLPPCSQENYEKAKEAFANKDTGKYSLASENCADTVNQFMENAGYPTSSKIIVTRPQEIAKHASSIAMDYIKDKRENILKLPSGPDKIRRLIENDIQRLEQQIKHDVISHGTLVKNAKKKPEKIKKLKSLLSEVSRFDVLSVEFKQKLYETSQQLSDKTLANLKQCFDVFPPPKSMQTIVEERADILDIIPDGLDKIRLLIKNDIQRLAEQLRIDKNSFKGLFKSAGKKDRKVVVLESLLKEFENIDELTPDSAVRKKFDEACKILNGKTRANLQECVSSFRPLTLQVASETRKSSSSSLFSEAPETRMSKQQESKQEDSEQKETDSHKPKFE